MKISIIGAGVVGQATGMGFCKYGHEVVFFDTDEEKLKTLSERGYTIANSFEMVGECDIHMICVPTPLQDGKFDLSCLESALVELARTLTKHQKYQLVVVRSTVLPFTTTGMVLPLLERHCSLSLGKDYGLCYNPEFMREAHALDDFLHSPVVIIGEVDPLGADMLAELYGSLGSPQMRTKPENAEAIKCFSNAYNAMKTSFFNALFLIARESGLDHEVLSEGLRRASLGVRLPEYYTSGGYPFGGKCLPKDLAACITFVREHGVDAKLFEAVAEINEAVGKARRNP